MELFNNNFNIDTALAAVYDQGYYFINAASIELLSSLEKEINSLNLEFGDHVNYPINKQTAQAVKQSHERAYRAIGSHDVPLATQLCYALPVSLRTAYNKYPELKDWLPTEIGYQRYRNSNDWIGPHRDRRSDNLLSITYTITGSAWVKIYESYTNPIDYKRLHLIDAHLTIPGTIMFLKAPGFGNGKQIIHEVMPPLCGERLILNLRMRNSVLKTPEEYRLAREQ